MTEQDENAAIEAQDNAGKHRYELVDTGADGSPVVGEAHYLDHGADERIFYHTVVDEAYGGRGLAGKLAEVALDATVEAGRKIVPVCPFIKKYVTRHADRYGAHVVSVKPAHLDALK